MFGLFSKKKSFRTAAVPDDPQRLYYEAVAQDGENFKVDQIYFTEWTGENAFGKIMRFQGFLRCSVHEGGLTAGQALDKIKELEDKRLGAFFNCHSRRGALIPEDRSAIYETAGRTHWSKMKFPVAKN